MTTHVRKTVTPSELLVFERTDVGRVRDHNEDSKYSDLQGRFFVVADGMGGHAAGEVASQLAVDAVKKQLQTEQEVLDTIGSKPSASNRTVMTELLTRVGVQANLAVRKRASEDKATHGMGTTLEVACVTGDGVWIAHVGDSRTYLIRGNAVTQLTTDHTVAQRLSKDNGVNNAAVFEQWGNILVEAIGAKDKVNVEVVHSPLESGDLLLLCSDGLYEYFPRAEEFAEVLLLGGSKAGLERLVDLAFDRGGKDNITGVLIEVVETPVALRETNSRSSMPSSPNETVEGPDPIEEYADQDYGINQAISLLRKLPGENIELEVRVVAQTLRSTHIAVAPIIRDASSKQQRIERRVHNLKNQIDELKQEVAGCQEEISALEADRAETTMVMDRLNLAQKLSKKQ